MDKLISFLVILKDAFVSVGKWIETHSNFFSAAATAFIAFFTLTLWWATRKLWKISNRSTGIAEDALVSGNRAFVFLKNININSFMKIEPKKVIIKPMWENSGNTQTKNMFTHDNWMFFPKDKFPTGIPDGFDFPDLGDKEHHPVLIGPKSTIWGQDLMIMEEIVNSAIAGLGKIYIWGWAEYNDIFKDTPRHRTEFCNEVIMDRVETEQVRVNFRICTKHNGADEQCLKKPMT